MRYAQEWLPKLFWEGIFDQQFYRSNDKKRELIDSLNENVIALLFAMVEANLRKHVTGTYEPNFLSRSAELQSKLPFAF